MGNMETVHSIFLSLSLLYFFFYLYMLSHRSAVKKEPLSLPDVTVLVALRNEEKNILACCMALNKLDYPTGKLEILLLNDGSTDNSRRIISYYIKDKQQFQLIDITENRDGLSGKINALAQAIQQTDNEYIFVTDADCQPQPGWIKTLLSYYDTQTALISGFTLLHSETAV
jgi:cellulose synthase/poly-beta-1,6-N-acetylglucosamine synthase-like glycosyltransferase